MAQNNPKLCQSHSISQEPYIIWLLFMVHMFKVRISPCFFFFWFVRGGRGWVKGQKKLQNNKTFCLSHSVSQKSQEPYIIWLSFMVHMCKVIISPCVFFIFSEFWFSELLGGGGVKKQKVVQNYNKFCPSCSISQYIMWLSFMVCVKW